MDELTDYGLYEIMKINQPETKQIKIDKFVIVFQCVSEYFKKLLSNVI